MNNDFLYFNRLSGLYQNELRANIIPFWEAYSIDKKHGGYFSCLDRTGLCYNTDKYVWLLARQVYTFAFFYNNIEKNENWLKIAINGAEFLKKYGRDSEGNWYFSLTKEGKPLIYPYNIFSDCFATLAFSQLSKAINSEEYADIARNTYINILKRRSNPKGKFNKSISEVRSLKSFSLPMILCNLSLEVESLIQKEMVEEIIDNCIFEVMEVFYDKSSGLILENVNTDGSFSDSFEGRLLNPGHAIEAMWFIMDLGVRKKNSKLILQAVEICNRTVEHGWDPQFGGIFYFMDLKGSPLQQLEWDQKLWWVHIESLVSLIKSFYLTGNKKSLELFQKVHNYTWQHFPDPEFGEWFGYLNRQGERLSDLKGGKWKGCFHIPRGLYQSWKTLEGLSN